MMEPRAEPVQVTAAARSEPARTTARNEAKSDGKNGVKNASKKGATKKNPRG
jgi:hypothetical protein